jgi:GTP:adenosylcobinamide-phosphate guanylyltransferase
VKAVITAGGPIDGDYADLARTRVKALAHVRGSTMLDRIIKSVREAGIDRIAVVGNDDVRVSVERRVDKIVPDAGTGAKNVLGALDAWPDDGEPLLYLTCDMPYITTAALASFLERVRSDTLAMPLTEIEDFVRRFPGAPPFGISLAGECVVNGGVFHIPAGGAERIRSFATALFDARKAPWRMATIAGPTLLLKFALKRLSIPELEARGRKILGMNVAALRNSPPELAYDADSVDEYRYAIQHD